MPVYLDPWAPPGKDGPVGVHLAAHRLSGCRLNPCFRLPRSCAFRRYSAPTQSSTKRIGKLLQAALARLIGVHEVTVCRWKGGKLIMSEWQRLLIAALLQVSPRAGLESLLGQPTINPLAVLSGLLAEAFGLASSGASIPSAGSTRPTARPGSPALKPSPEALANPHATRFGLLEVDEE